MKGKPTLEEGDPTGVEKEPTGLAVSVRAGPGLSSLTLVVCQHVFQLICTGQEHLVESKAAAADSLEEEKEKAEREETEEKVGEGGVTRNSSIL